MQIFVSNQVRDPNLKYNPISLGQMQQTYWNQVVITLSPCAYHIVCSSIGPVMLKADLLVLVLQSLMILW